jgi:predicted ATPase/class 3 adenylate cyclase
LADTNLPTGTVTFIFVDLEGSTRLLAALKDAYGGLLEDYYRVVEDSFVGRDGRLIDRAGDGLFYSFHGAKAAVAAALDAQRAMTDREWPSGVSVRARMGLHTGEPTGAAGSYVGMDVHRAARIAASGHGGQVLLSQTTAQLVADDLPTDASLLDLGEHWLKDLVRAEHIFQVAADGLPSSFPALRSLVTLPNNLPRNLSSFVGRDTDLEEARQLLAESPLVTITGAGGVGKTRFAVQLAAELLEAHEDGVWLAELETLTDGSLMLQTVASALGIVDEGDGTLSDVLISHLRGRRVLLVLDNCEHVVEACARMANTLLRACPELRILATSREALAVPGETLFPLRSLTLPPIDQLPPLERLTEFESVRLFIERARASEPSFELTESNAAPLVEICRRLDGIPLAIELAAARVRSLGTDQIAARLDDRFRLLTGGSRTALPRHQTLRATIDWSFGLLGDSERAVMRRLAVFAGGFTLEAAEAVCSGDGVEPFEVVDHLGRLVDKSLVGRQGDGYRLLDTMREYSRQSLVTEDEAEATYTRHRDWYLDLVERAKAAFSGPAPSDWIERFEREHDNLRAALGWSLRDPAGAESALRLAAGLWRFWELRGYLLEGRSWLERVLELDSQGSAELSANVLTGAGVLSGAAGDLAASIAHLEESLALYRELGDGTSISVALHNLANAYLQAGSAERARALYEESAAMAREAGDQVGLPFVLLHVAEAADLSGDYDSASGLYEEVIAMFDAQGHQWGLAYALTNYGQAMSRRQDTGQARSKYEQAHRLYGQLGDRRGEARTLALLAEVALAEGDRFGSRNLLYESLGIRCQLGDRPGIITAFEKLAAAAASEDPLRSARILGATERMRERTGARLSLGARAARDQQLAELRARLGEEVFAAAMTEGRRSRLQDALREAAGIVSG